MPDPYSYIIKSYRYLRLAMIMVIVMLSVSVVYEWSKTKPLCYLSSISAYYYTPVQAVFVGALISVGVCMVALRGNTTAEDVLLNIGGMLAPVVALVPTPRQDLGTCSSVPITVSDAAANIDNNIWAVFGAGAVALVTAAVIAVRDGERKERVEWAGMAVAILLLAAGIWWFVGYRAGFTRWAHYAAAFVLLACIVLVVLLNSYDNRRKRAADDGGSRKRAFTPAYFAIAVLMVLSALVPFLVDRLSGWGHWLLWTELLLIALFGVFWTLQTAELWHEGVRGGPTPLIAPEVAGPENEGVADHPVPEPV